MRGTGWPDLPQAQRVQIEQLVRVFRTLLGKQLVGMYVHGSMAMRSFYPEHSDIDLLVVCRDPLGHDVQDAIMDELLRRSNHPSPLELHIVTQKALCQQAYPLPFELHYSEHWRERILQGQWPKGNDPDLAAHLTVLKQRGCCLAGVPIDEIIPVVPREEFEKAIRSDIVDVQRDIQEKPVYFILNLCRVIWYMRKGVICSKDEAGKWGIQHLPEVHRKTIRAALAFQRGESEKFAASDIEAEAFARYALGEIEMLRYP
ncbi:MAG: aminoglycoside adenylyltransferase domain-containing protein [Clostridia bacterium]